MAELAEGEGNTSKEYHMNKKKIKMKYEKERIKLGDDLIFLILTRLPAKSLKRFSSVCESWDVLVNKDRFFAAQHINAQSRPAIVSLTKTDGHNRELTLNYGYGSELHTVFSSMPDLKVDHMTNSCNGLVGIYNSERFWLVNPSIKKIAELPLGSLHIDVTHSQQINFSEDPILSWSSLKTYLPASAIGCESSTGDYKVVRIFQRENWSIECEMFSLTNGTWKSVNDPPSLPLCRSFLPVVVNDFIYWTVQPIKIRLIDVSPGAAASPEISVCFNMREEAFSVVLHPMRDLRPLGSKIVNLGGYVCVADASLGEQMMIWRLKDKLKSEWVKLYEIDIWKERILPSAVPLAIDCGRIVLEYEGYMHYYDPRTMTFVKCEDTGKDGFFARCVESVVWPYYE